MEEIYGIIVTYNPDIINLKANISSIMRQVDKLLIFDNNSRNKEEIRTLQKQLSFEAIYSDENVGLSKAYNAIIFPNINSCEFFVTFDQDTYISEKTIETLLNIIKGNVNLGVLGPVFTRDKEYISNGGKLHFVPVIIQSCAIFRTTAIAKTGGFNEDYFIDSVDFEYCLRMLQNGYTVAKYDGVCIRHELGNGKKFMGMNYYSHNKLRNYYIARNHVNLSKRFFKSFPSFILKKNIFFILHFLKLVIFERDVEKIRYFIKGIKNNKL